MLYLNIFIILTVTELLYFKIADYFNIIDKPNERSSHTKITLRGGGMIFYVAIFIYFIYSSFSFPYFFAGLTLIGIISFMDDINPKSAKLRIIVHIVSMFLIFYQCNIYTFPWYIWILALIFCIGIINAYNFMDGINGITGGYSIVVAGTLWYINSKVIVFTDNNLIIVLIMSLIVFNYFNFRTKAKCFAGDVGSVSVAFVLIFLIAQLIIQTGDFSYLILLVVYGVDSVMTILHRIKLKEDLTQAHRKHLYQLMANELNMKHLIVSAIYMMVQAIINIGFLFVSNHYLYLMMVVVALMIVYVLFMKKNFHLHLNKTESEA